MWTPKECVLAVTQKGLCDRCWGPMSMQGLITISIQDLRPKVHYCCFLLSPSQGPIEGLTKRQWKASSSNRWAFSFVPVSVPIVAMAKEDCHPFPAHIIDGASMGKWMEAGLWMDKSLPLLLGVADERGLYLSGSLAPWWGAGLQKHVLSIA